MKIELVFIGKTTDDYLKEGIEIYLNRLKNYLPVSVTVFPASSAKSPERILSEESLVILSKLQPRDHIVLLDEKGKEVRSVELAVQMEKWMLKGINRLVFIIGGAYGVSDEVKAKAHSTLSLSKLTFTHQMIRLLLAEQLYRAMTITRNESYHHE